MSASIGASARRHPPDDIRHLGALAAIPIVLAMLAVGLASADPPSGVVQLSAADAARTGSTINLVPRSVAGSTLLEVQPGGAGFNNADGGPSLVALSSDGANVALADRLGELAGELTIARADGSQLRIQLPGLLAAVFAEDGAWLAVIDGRGALWRVDAANGQASPLADGPFLGSPIAADDGSLLLLSVPSVQAPYRSQLVRFVPSTGEATPLSSDELVYAAYPLTDGNLAVVAHQPGGTVVHSVGGGGSQLLADLGADAVNVAVAPDGRHIAFERAGRGIFLIDLPGGAPMSLGSGSRPCLAADAGSLLVKRGSESAALALDGSVLATMDRLTGLVGSAGCLP